MPPRDPLPVGELVDPRPLRQPQRKPLEGPRIALSPLDPGRDAAELYAVSHADAIAREIWTYMPNGPFRDEADMRAYLEQRAAADDPLFFTVFDRTSGRAIGMTSFMRIHPEGRCLELGHIWYAPSHQRGAANPEAIYLMLREAFDGLEYRRVEWKCDSLNARSRRAAERLGFRYEGTFRQHLIIRGRNRDTAWFSMLDSEWSEARAALEERLGPI